MSTIQSELEKLTRESTADWLVSGCSGDVLEKPRARIAERQGDRTDNRIRIPRCAAF